MATPPRRRRRRLSSPDSHTPLPLLSTHSYCVHQTAEFGLALKPTEALGALRYRAKLAFSRVRPSPLASYTAAARGTNVFQSIRLSIAANCCAVEAPAGCSCAGRNRRYRSNRRPNVTVRRSPSRHDSDAYAACDHTPLADCDGAEKRNTDDGLPLCSRCSTFPGAGLNHVSSTRKRMASPPTLRW